MHTIGLGRDRNIPPMIHQQLRPGPRQYLSPALRRGIKFASLYVLVA